MVMNGGEVVDVYKRLKEALDAEREGFDRLRDYVRDSPDRWARFLPTGVPREVREMARVARVNVLRYVLRAAYQQLYIEGIRGKRASENVTAWSELWQPNQMDLRQVGINKAALTYGKSYIVALPGDPAPTLRGVSPRYMSALYGDDDLWPELSLERRRSGWRIYDRTHWYDLSDTDDSYEVNLAGEPVEHHAGRTPVVRLQESSDLDDPTEGIIKPLINLQEQINLTTFNLLVAQHYGAFKQRYIIGWVAPSEEEKLKASAAKLWSFEDSPDEIRVGEFSQTDVSGFLNSRQASFQHVSTISQTNAYELLGQLTNLSADALAAVAASQQRAAGEHRLALGEGYEQAIWLGGHYIGESIPLDAEARWRNTELTSLGMLVDALGKMAQMLKVPEEALWERLADAMGASQKEIEGWKQIRSEPSDLQRMIDRLDQRAARAGDSGAGDA